MPHTSGLLECLGVKLPHLGSPELQGPSDTRQDEGPKGTEEAETHL